MFLCFVSNGSGGWVTSQVSASSECVGFVAQSAGAYVDPTALETLFKLYFDFDPILASQIMGWYFFSFAMGHGLGRMMRTWQKGGF